jgi:hypothetical protein
MKRIGTTTDGGALIEFTRGEVSTIQSAMALLNAISAEVGDAGPSAEVAPPPGCSVDQAMAQAVADYVTCVPLNPPAVAKLDLSKIRERAAPTGKQKTCTACGQTKPAKEYYGKAQQCKRCVLDRQKAAKAAKKGKPAKTDKPAKPAVAAPIPPPEAPAEKIPANMRRCSLCGELKPKSDYYTGHGRCKPCFSAAAKTAKAAKDAVADMQAKKAVDHRASTSARPSRVANLTEGVKALRYGPRDRDAALDPPQQFGRTMPVGAAE